MFIRKAQGTALAALLVSAAVPALAQDDVRTGLFQLVPGTVVVFSPATGLYYQVPANFAYEICPDIDQAYLVTDFAGTTEVVCEVDAATAADRDFTGFAWARDDDNDGVPEESGDAEADGDDAAETGVDAGAEAGVGTDAGTGAGAGTGTGDAANDATDAADDAADDANDAADDANDAADGATAPTGG